MTSHYLTMIKQWFAVVGVAALFFFIVASLISLLQNGTAAPRLIWATLVRGFRDLVFLSFTRIFAIARLTATEAYRSKIFAIGIVFLGIIMFGGWFLRASNNDTIAPYVSTVITPMWFMLVPMSLLISCWGLPADIKERSIHTVVTKPVRRSEILIGRMCGYGAVLTAILLTVAIANYFWLMGQVPEKLKDQLVARVPVYGALDFLDRQGVPATKGINVGDPWTYRSYIEGSTASRAIWKFGNLNLDELKTLPTLPLEHRFEAFRTVKGTIEDQTRFRVTLVNAEKNLRVKLPEDYPVREFAAGGRDRVIEIPHQIEQATAANSSEAQKPPLDLFADFIDSSDPDWGHSLTVEVECVDPQQFIGVNPADLFIRMPDKSFTGNYIKAMIGIWLLVMLLVIFGTTSSCFVKGPVATLLCGGLIILGYHLADHLTFLRVQAADQGISQKVGGPLQAFYQLVTKAPDLPDNLGTKVIITIDQFAVNTLMATEWAVPNLQWFSTESSDSSVGLDISRGFDIPVNDMWVRLLVVFSYFIPMVILGYFSLHLRELEHK